MKKNLILGSLVALGLTSGISFSTVLAADGAKADLEAKSTSKVSGSITFTQKGDTLKIEGKVANLSPGKHGIHVHAKGDCSAADGSSAGDHFKIAGESHGGKDADTSHLGDLGNVEANDRGDATVSVETKRLCLDPKKACSVVGKAIVIHDKIDDLKSQPAGNSGSRVACGVIKAN